MYRRSLVILTLLLAPALTARAADSLAILPGDFTLTGPAARQTLLLETLHDGTAAGELTDGISFTSSDPHVVRIENGAALPVGNGQATITAAAGDRQATIKVTVKDADKPFTPSFRNNVQPILAAAGCSSGACHGAAAGKNGFKLSLRGYDDEGDWRTITRHAVGRRVNPADPAHSLLLMKPTTAVPHKGGEKIKVGSVEYNLLGDWIASGAPGPKPDDPRIQRIELVPDHVVLKPGVTQQFLVRATFSDGTVQDVTRWAKYTAGDTAVATIDDGGKVKVMGNGEGPITAWYLSRITTAAVTVPFEAPTPSDTFDKAPRRNF